MQVVGWRYTIATYWRVHTLIRQGDYHFTPMNPLLPTALANEAPHGITVSVTFLGHAKFIFRHILPQPPASKDHVGLGPGGSSVEMNPGGPDSSRNPP